MSTGVLSESDSQIYVRLKLLGALLVASKLSLFYFQLSLWMIVLVCMLSVTIIYAAILVRNEGRILKGLNSYSVAAFVRSAVRSSTFFAHLQEIELSKMKKDPDSSDGQVSHLNLSFQIKDRYPHLRKHFETLPFEPEEVVQAKFIKPANDPMVIQSILKDLQTIKTKKANRGLSLPQKRSEDTDRLQDSDIGTVKRRDHDKDDGKRTPKKGETLKGIQRMDEDSLFESYKANNLIRSEDRRSRLFSHGYETPKQAEACRIAKPNLSDVVINTTEILDVTISKTVKRQSGKYGLEGETVDPRAIERLISARNAGKLATHLNKTRAEQQPVIHGQNKSFISMINANNQVNDSDDEIYVQSFFAKNLQKQSN